MNATPGGKNHILAESRLRNLLRGGMLQLLAIAHLGFHRNFFLSVCILVLSHLWDGRVLADELVVPQVQPNSERIKVIYRFDGPVRGRVRLDVEWTDILGRVVDRRTINRVVPFGNGLRFSLDRSRAITVKNRLAVQVSVAGTGHSRSEREAGKQVWFYVPARNDRWSDFQIVIWQRQTERAYAALREIGVTAGAVLSDRQEVPGNGVVDQINRLLDLNLGWYLENAATDFYSSYHRWFPDRPGNWRFEEAKRLYSSHPEELRAFVREPSLSDPAWVEKVSARLRENVRMLQRYGALYYNLGDEPGIADLTAFWDFDLSAASLDQMRNWLKTRYGRLNRLNREWGSSFQRWDDVIPTLTNDAIRRTDQNFASWADFKEWMDVAFARALERGSDAVHASDPSALSAIEGAQISGWGGYDYSHLAGSVDAMELDAPGLLRSLNPEAVILSTSYESGPTGEHEFWRKVLQGARGLILWDNKDELVDEQGNLGDRGRAAAAAFRELREGFGGLLINSKPHFDPVGILYSPSSMRIQWLLDRIGSGEDWTQRKSETELEDNAIRVSERSFSGALARIGVFPRLIAADLLENGEVSLSGCRVLILPKTISLSDRAAETIRRFVAAGGTVIADGEPGAYDEHGRKRERPALTDLFGATWPGAMDRAQSRHKRILLPTGSRLDGGVAERQLRTRLQLAGIKPVVSLSGTDGQRVEDVESFAFENGSVTVLALLRKPDPKGAGEPKLEPLAVSFRSSYKVYDVRAGRGLGRMARLNISVGSTAPTVLALSRRRSPRWTIAGPGSIRAGGIAKFRLTADADGKGSMRRVLHIDAIDPAGHKVAHYSRNIVAATQTASYSLPLALNDAQGLWTIRARDVIGGQIATRRVRVSR